MNQQDEVFESFRKNQHKLNERPSLQAWNRLEKRLDQQQKQKQLLRPKFALYRLIMLAAAAVALVFFLTTMTDIAEMATERKSILVIKENARKDKQPIQHFAKEQAFRETYAHILQKTVEEGSTGRLVVANNKAIRPFLLPKKS